MKEGDSKMAFGNATKGYVKKHGGSGGGTKDYEDLLNKPSINGIELLGDKKIGTLSGDIKMTLSDVSNMNLSNVADAQTLIFNALNQKWENRTPATPAILDVTADASTGFDASGYNAIIIVGRYFDSQSNKSWCFAGLYPIDMLTNDTILTACDDHSNVYCDVTVNNSTITVTKNSISTADREIYKVYLIK